MKAEHRKELKTNALSAHLTSLLHGVTEHKYRPPTAVWALVVVAVGVVLFFWFYSGHVRSMHSQQWEQFGTVTNVGDNTTADEQLTTLVNDGRSTSVGLVARFQKARRLLESGLQGLASTGRNQAASDLETARELYGEVAQQAGDYPVLQQRAWLGQAKAEEALVGFPKAPNSSESRGDLKQAIAYYDEYLQHADPETPVAKSVRQHVDELKQNSTQVVEFYKELHRMVDTQMPVFSSSASSPDASATNP